MLKYLIVCLGFLVVACGFQPLYTHTDELLKETSSVQVEPISGEGGYQMTLYLLDKLNPQKVDVAKKYRLMVQLDTPTFSKLSVQKNNFANLEKMMLKAQYKLVNIQNNKVVISSSVDSNGLFSLVKDPYATVVAKDKLYENLLHLMADDIATHVLSYFKGIQP